MRVIADLRLLRKVSRLLDFADVPDLSQMRKRCRPSALMAGCGRANEAGLIPDVLLV